MIGRMEYYSFHRLSMLAVLSIVLLSLLRDSCSFQVPESPRTRPRQHVASRSRLFSARTAQVDLSAQAPRNYNNFVSWANHYGVVPENFQVNQRSSNWGAEASQPAAAGSRVLFVPGMLRMTSQMAREQDFAGLESSVYQYIDPAKNDGDTSLACHFFLFLKVLKEYDQGDQSPYYPWLGALPRKFSTALSFDDFEMDCLPPFVKFLAERDRENYNLFVQVLQQLNIPSISSSSKSNPEITKWAFNVVFTRARPAYGEAEIIPMSDMLNHAWNANCEVQYDNDGNVHVVLLRDVQAGEALHKCYGQPTNPSRFMATYGFFDASPPTTYCKFMPNLAVTPELKNLGFEYDRMVFYVENGGVAQEVWDVMLFFVLGRVDPSTQERFYQAHMQGDGNTKSQIHQQYMQQTCYALLEHVNDVLEEIADCQDTIDQGGMGLAHENLPVIRRHNDFVRQTFSKVKKNLEQMAGR